MLQSVTHVHSRAAPDVPTESERDKLQAAPRLHLRFLREMPSRRPAGRPCGRTRPWPCRCSLQKGKNDLAPGRAHGAPSGAGGERCGGGPPFPLQACRMRPPKRPCTLRRGGTKAVTSPGGLSWTRHVMSTWSRTIEGGTPFSRQKWFCSDSAVPVLLHALHCKDALPPRRRLTASGRRFPPSIPPARIGATGRQMDGLADVRGRISAAATPRSTRRPPFYCDARSLW